MLPIRILQGARYSDRYHDIPVVPGQATISTLLIGAPILPYNQDVISYSRPLRMLPNYPQHEVRPAPRPPSPDRSLPPPRQRPTAQRSLGNHYHPHDEHLVPPQPITTSGGGIAEPRGYNSPHSASPFPGVSSAQKYGQRGQQVNTPPSGNVVEQGDSASVYTHASSMNRESIQSTSTANSNWSDQSRRDQEPFYMTLGRPSSTLSTNTFGVPFPPRHDENN